ncbi:MAG: pyridoxamine 5'-phosphate oxidase family protein [Actinomycetota bacterium]
MPPVAERPSSMADYGVPSDDEQLLPWEWADERLARSRNYWLTTVDAHGRPHSMPVWGVWLSPHERWWFSCATTSAKARRLAANPNVVVTADDSVEVVSLEGHATPDDGRFRDEVLDAYLAKYGSEIVDSDETPAQARDALAEFIDGGNAYVVTPRLAFGVIERPDDFGPRATRWRWSTT